LEGMKAALQYPLAVERATWQGEPVAVAVAQSRALAEDALHAIVIEWEPLPALADPHAALAPGAAPIHPELGDNLLFSARVDSGGVDEAFACAHRVVAARLHTE